MSCKTDSTKLTVNVSQPKKLRKKNALIVAGSTVQVKEDGTFYSGENYRENFSNGNIYIGGSSSPAGGSYISGKKRGSPPQDGLITF